MHSSRIAAPSVSGARPSLSAPLWIGSVCVDPPLLQAPMAGYSNYAYRALLRDLGGVGLPATEMVSARSIAELRKRDAPLPGRLWGVEHEPRPLAAQVWDNTPETLAAVGRDLAHVLRVSVVDLNFGCPAPQVRQKARSGAYLLRYPDQIGQIVASVVEACRPVPVTAKIRLGPSREQITALEVAQAVEEAGAAALTVHGRTARDMFRGKADWEAIAGLKAVLRRIPLIGNGDIQQAEDAVAARRDYGVDAVMIGRAGLGRPWLFHQAAEALAGRDVPPDPTPQQQGRLLLTHFDLTLERFGAHPATILMRRYACNYGHGTPGAKAWRGAISRVRTADEFRRAVHEHFFERAVS